MAEAAVAGGGLDRRRWVPPWVIGLAQLMVVLDRLRYSYARVVVLHHARLNGARGGKLAGVRLMNRTSL